MDKHFLKKVLDVPFKKCRITRCHFPMTLMLRLIEVKNNENRKLFIPDSLYTNVNYINVV